MDVGDWLRSLGLGQYESAFRQNKIDGEVLPQLTAEDLKDIGVAIVGDRRKMLTAIAELFFAARAPAATPPAAPEPPPAAAERRQLTVMFCDLVGSTAMSARLDPEDMRSIIGAYHRCCAELIERNGGFVAKYMGDGVLAYFGYPQAHEHDSERAVLGGLAIVEAAPNLVTSVGAPLHVRVGIATGLVVVGDLIGSGESQERGIVGDTPNLAARLQAIAESDTVVIADATRKLLGSLFEFQDLGTKDLKGIAGASRAWAAVRPSSAESRFEALHATGVTPLVGREDELQSLERLWAEAKNGEGRVALIAGEAGIGKSRLTAALLEHVAPEQHTRLRYFCSPQHTNSAFYPIIGQMERAAGMAHDDAPRAKLDKLDALLARTSTSIEDAALFADMLSLPNDGRYPKLDLAASQRRQGTLTALMAQTEALTRQNPVLIIFEDAHWTDPTSLEAFGRLVDRIKTLSVLLIVTFRPEFEPPWVGQPHVTRFTIGRLAQRDVDALINLVVGNKPIPANARNDIIERTDGIPLFVEEMTKAVLDAEGEGEARRTISATPSPALAVPASLHASLMARLDRLGPAKEVAQVGAAIGREFSHALLAAVARKPALELRLALDRLIQAGLLFRQGLQPHANYLFKHALVQDAAYGTLLRDSRRALHARIGETLESQFAEIAESRPELLARHCTEAGLVEKAAGLWGKAGQRSLERSALVEAAEQLARALDQIATLPGSAARRREQIKLQVALITPLIHVKGYAASETKAAVDQAHQLVEQAEALGEPTEDPLLLFSVLYGFWVANYVGFNGDAARKLAAQFLELAGKQGATGPLMVGHRMMGISLTFTGEITEGRAHYDQAIALYDRAEHLPLATRFGHDPGVANLTYRSSALWLLGNPEAALKDMEDAVKSAREIGQAATLMYALTHAAIPNTLAGNYEAAAAQTQEALALAEEKSAPHWKGFAMMNQGWLLALTGNPSDAVQLIASGIAVYRSTGSTNWMPLRLSSLAMAHAQLGQFDDAWRYVEEAITLVDTTRQKWCDAEVQRVAGEIARMSSEPDAAKAGAHFARALTIARAQQAKSWELRAATSLARLKWDQGKPSDARELLAPAYDWFTEGFDTLDLKQAKALLDALASRRARE